MNYYPLLKKEHASIEKTIAQKALAASSRMPKFWASVESQYGNDPVYVFGALLRENKFTAEDFALKRLNSPAAWANDSAQAGVEWTLFDFSQTAARIKAAGILTESAQYQARFTRMEAIMAASEVYSRLAAADALLDVLEKQTSGGRADVAAAEALGRTGQALGADFYLARLTQTQLLQMKNETAAQRAALNLVFNVLRGVDPAVPVAVKMDFAKPIEVTGSVGEWMDQAINNRPDIKAMARLLEAGGVEVTAESKSVLPKVVAFGGADEDVHRIGSSGGGNYMFGLKVRMDLFDPGHAPRVKMAQEKVRELSAAYQEKKDQAARDAADVYWRLRALGSNIRLAGNACADAGQALKLLEPLYREGRSSIGQMLSIRSEVVAARERWLGLEAARRENALTLKLYAGQLTPEAAEAIYGQ
ncbi:MAG: TolC family protein [Candidatus Omnitrophica bacterium]|nr:TolC family protein [Candidatus Omnitrophota bacterium]MDE2214833.1 TolC family protein [Candidatus Omnitrophota bacterium]MDE2231953.1 TolC family protein [Candidatus Omnitrophota bacterium]